MIAVSLVVVGMFGSTAHSMSADGKKYPQCSKYHNQYCKSPAELKAIHKQFKFCNSWRCVHRVIRKQHVRVLRYYKHHEFMPTCTWIGESGTIAESGPAFGAYRYTINNGHRGHNIVEGVAHGKYQMMPSTYRTYARWFDWSPADQELAAHRLYHASGINPWQACTG